MHANKFKLLCLAAGHISLHMLILIKVWHTNKTPYFPILQLNSGCQCAVQKSTRSVYCHQMTGNSPASVTGRFTPSDRALCLTTRWPDTSGPQRTFRCQIDCTGSPRRVRRLRRGLSLRRRDGSDETRQPLKGGSCRDKRHLCNTGPLRSQVGWGLTE